MEMTLPNGLVATLVSFADGSSSLYISSGACFIGGHSHESVRRAASRFLAMVNQLHRSMEPTRTSPLPTAGHVSFYARTDAGLLRADAVESELTAGHHKLSPVFVAGHAVIAELRKVFESKKPQRDQA